MREDLAQRFGANRRDMRSVACHLLGSAADADDAVQSAWPKVSRADADSIDNAQAGVVQFIDGAPGIAIAPAGRLQALLRILIGNDGRIHAIDIVGGADRLRTATLALPNLSAAAPRNTTAASVTKDGADLTRRQERHVR